MKSEDSEIPVSRSGFKWSCNHSNWPGPPRTAPAAIGDTFGEEDEEEVGVFRGLRAYGFPVFHRSFQLIRRASLGISSATHEQLGWLSTRAPKLRKYFGKDCETTEYG